LFNSPIVQRRTRLAALCTCTKTVKAVVIGVGHHPEMEKVEGRRGGGQTAGAATAFLKLHNLIFFSGPEQFGKVGIFMK
jgi:hypothetical protein